MIAYFELVCQHAQGAGVHEDDRQLYDLNEYLEDPLERDWPNQPVEKLIGAVRNYKHHKRDL